MHAPGTAQASLRRPRPIGHPARQNATRQRAGARALAVLACVCACVCALAGPAFRMAAADAPSGAGAPAAWSVTPNPDAQAGVEVSATGDAALAEGAPWGLSDFYRAQAGSNRPIDGVYRGYSYYAGSEPGLVAAVSTGAYAVVYVPLSAAAQLGLDPQRACDRELLAATLAALDAAGAQGSARLDEVPIWYLTTEPRFDVGAVSFRFDQELAPGNYYACVVGVDGSDVTTTSNPERVDLSHAGFARLTDAAVTAIATDPSGLAWLANFLGSIDYSPLWVTVKTTGTAIAIVFVLGLAAAWATLRAAPRVQDALDSVFTVPMVLPPTVCGFVLLLLLGNNTALGRWFADVGLPLVFSWEATVIAAAVVAFPLMYRSARGAFENLDRTMLDAARTLGWGEARIFFRLMMPLAGPSIAAGTVLAFARALGEFGATLFLAGNYAGVTRTVPIAIYFEWMNGNTDVALFWTLVVMAFSFAVVLFVNLWSRRTARHRARPAR